MLVKIDARIYEGTSCRTQDLDGQHVEWVRIWPNETKPFDFRVRSSERAGGDFADFKFKVTNRTS